MPPRHHDYSDDQLHLNTWWVCSPADDAAGAVLQLHTRAATLPNYVSSAEELTAVGLRLMRAEYPLTLRLIGIRRVDMQTAGDVAPHGPCSGHVARLS